MSTRLSLSSTRRWVVKIGSALLTDNGRALNAEAMGAWVEQMAQLRKADIEVVLVSSGAVAAGVSSLGWTERPRAIHDLQAAAAVGQMRLVQTWESLFQQWQCRTAQILLDNDDLSNRRRYLNARNTLKTLIDLDVVPVVNENDTVVTDEIRFGDNDTLAALVANLVEADVLVILTDQDGLYDADPRSKPDARLIPEALARDPQLVQMAGASGSAVGRGGMQTKVRAAQLAARSGTDTVIAGGRLAQVLTRIQQGDNIGTWLRADQAPVAARKQWLAGQLQFRGKLVLDDGAVSVLQTRGKSLLPVGVKSVDGEFSRGELVICVDLQGREVARGLVNYSAAEARLIQGLASAEIEAALGYIDDEELVHRDNLVLK